MALNKLVDELELAYHTNKGLDTAIPEFIEAYEANKKTGIDNYVFNKLEEVRKFLTSNGDKGALDFFMGKIYYNKLVSTPVIELLDGLFESMRLLAVEKSKDPNFDGLTYWRDIKSRFSTNPIIGFKWIPISQERSLSALGHPSNHFVEQQVNLPNGPLTVRKFIQLAYNCGQGHSDPRTLCSMNDFINEL